MSKKVLSQKKIRPPLQFRRQRSAVPKRLQATERNADGDKRQRNCIPILICRLQGTRRAAPKSKVTERQERRTCPASTATDYQQAETRPHECGKYGCAPIADEAHERRKHACAAAVKPHIAISIPQPRFRVWPKYGFSTKRETRS